MIGGVVATAAVQAWPFRVFSFPTQIKIAPNLPLGFIKPLFTINTVPFYEDTYAPSQLFKIDYYAKGEVWGGLS